MRGGYCQTLVNAALNLSISVYGQAAQATQHSAVFCFVRTCDARGWVAFTHLDDNALLTKTLLC